MCVDYVCTVCKVVPVTELMARLGEGTIVVEAEARNGRESYMDYVSTYTVGGCVG